MVSVLGEVVGLSQRFNVAAEVFAFSLSVTASLSLFARSVHPLSQILVATNALFGLTFPLFH